MPLAIIMRLSVNFLFLDTCALQCIVNHFSSTFFFLYSTQRSILEKKAKKPYTNHLANGNYKVTSPNPIPCHLPSSAAISYSLIADQLYRNSKKIEGIQCIDGLCVVYREHGGDPEYSGSCGLCGSARCQLPWFLDVVVDDFSYTIISYQQLQ
ncbi:hypothetical protein BZA70DRAFT_281084 [Myxozyma melibiosi]|uniref:Uncharacterized protein n=1 Tax=Myxozyma melibiosi TaxID=54550 RepID=A0ABR1F404_9ASCO